MAGPDPLNFTATVVTLASSVAKLLVGINPYRSYLAIQNTGAGALSFSFKPPPTGAGGGPSLDPPSAAGGQGGIWEWSNIVPQNSVYGYSAAGTTVVVVEGT